RRGAAGMTIAPFPVPPIVKSVTVCAAPARAFALFAERFARWWPLARVHTGPDPVDCAIEPRVGGGSSNAGPMGAKPCGGPCWFTGSPEERAALSTLEEKAAVDELAAMRPGTLKQQPHLSRHPFGRIPAFQHDGWMLYETRAIMRYVDAVVPGPRLQPEEPRAA